LIKNIKNLIARSSIRNIYKKLSFGLVVLTLGGTGSSKNTGVDTILIVQFKAYVHGEPMQLNKKYQNPFGETYEISRFRFYAGRIAPVYSDTNFKSISSSGYHLIDFSDSSSTQISLSVKVGACNGIKFLVGVDSIDQVRGAQSGDLDPAKGMFWTWNSGYLTFKLEGYSPVSNEPAHMMAYHIGGYRHTYNTVWNVKLYSTNDVSFMVSDKNKIKVEIGIDLDYFFDGTTPLRIKESPSCTTTGEMSRKLSGNFIGAFTELLITSRP
jgi:hypothetical protein